MFLLSHGSEGTAADVPASVEFDSDDAVIVAARGLQARHDVAVDVELPPPRHDFDDVVIDMGDEGLRLAARVRRLRFDDPGTIDGALAAAVASWDAAGGPGSYRVDVTPWGRRLVATTQTGANGRAMDYDSPLDCVIEQPALVGSSAWMVAWFVADVNAQCGQRVVHARTSSSQVMWASCRCGQMQTTAASPVRSGWMRSPVRRGIGWTSSWPPSAARPTP